MATIDPRYLPVPAASRSDEREVHANETPQRRDEANLWGRGAETRAVQGSALMSRADLPKTFASNVVPLPDALDEEIGTILDPPPGNAVHTALSFDLIGGDVPITCTGPIGMTAAAAARSTGRATCSGRSRLRTSAGGRSSGTTTR